jgi:hypothetical protein
VDRLTTLAVKRQHFSGEALTWVEQEQEQEQALLQQAFRAAAPRLEPELRAPPQAVNIELWHCEEAICACDRQHDFGRTSVELARRIHHLTSRRAPPSTPANCRAAVP